MPQVVAFAGGSSGLGRAIVEAFKADGRYDLVILSRKVDADREKEIGVRFLAADYSSEDSLVALLEDNNISVVISTMNTGIDPTPEYNLIKAADKSKVTKRYIPNVWSAIVFTEINTESFPLAKLRIGVIDALKASDLEWTAIYVGIFLDFYVPSLPTYGTATAVCVDVNANVAGIPGTGNEPVVVTHNFDIGKFVPPLLGLDKWEDKYFIVGDKTTFNEIVAVAEEAKGVKFKVTYDSVEDLKAGKVTEIPAMQPLFDMMGGGEQAKAMVAMIMSKMGLFFQEGGMDYKDGAFLNEMFPEIKPMTLREAFAKAYPKA